MSNITSFGTTLLHPMDNTKLHLNTIESSTHTEPLPDTQCTLSDWEFILSNHLEYLKDTEENIKDKEEIDTYIRITSNMLQCLIKFWKELQLGCQCGYDNTISDIDWKKTDTDTILYLLTECSEFTRRNNFAQQIIKSLNHIQADLNLETNNLQFSY